MEADTTEDERGGKCRDTVLHRLIYESSDDCPIVVVVSISKVLFDLETQ